MITQLSGLINGEFWTSWRSFGEMVAKVCVVTKQSYTVLLEIRSSLRGPEARMTWFQAPLNIEDALGRRYQICSVNFTFDMLDAAIKARFSAGPGSIEVRFGNYEYFKTRNSKEVLSNESPLLPGTDITMAVIVVLQTLTGETCPMPKCGSANTSECSGGGRTCRECRVWFSPTKKRRRSVEDCSPSSSKERRRMLDNSAPSVFSISNSPGTDSKVDDTEPPEILQDSYKNVRLATIDRPSRCQYCRQSISMGSFETHFRSCRTKLRETRARARRARRAQEARATKHRPNLWNTMPDLTYQKAADENKLSWAYGTMSTPSKPWQLHGSSFSGEFECTYLPHGIPDDDSSISIDYSRHNDEMPLGLHPSALSIDYRRETANRRLTSLSRATRV